MAADQPVPDPVKIIEDVLNLSPEVWGCPLPLAEQVRDALAEEGLLRRPGDRTEAEVLRKAADELDFESPRQRMTSWDSLGYGAVILRRLADEAERRAKGADRG